MMNAANVRVQIRTLTHQGIHMLPAPNDGAQLARECAAPDLTPGQELGWTQAMLNTSGGQMLLGIGP